MGIAAKLTQASMSEQLAQPAAQPAAIRLQNVGMRRGERWILRDINWTVPAGSCCAILGPNGSGKSTLTRILAAHLWPTTGEVAVLGGKFGETSLPELRQSIRLVQAAGPYDVEPELTAREVVRDRLFRHARLVRRDRRCDGPRRRCAARASRPVARGGADIRDAQQRRARAQPDRPVRWRRGRSCCCSMSRRPASICCARAGAGDGAIAVRQRRSHAADRRVHHPSRRRASARDVARSVAR